MPLKRGFIHKKKPRVFVFLSLISFTSHGDFQIYLFSPKNKTKGNHDSILFLQPNGTSQYICTYHILFTSVSTDGHPGRFHDGMSPHWFLTEGKSAGVVWHAHAATLPLSPLPEFFQSWTALISQPFITKSKLHSLCPEASCLWEDFLTRIPTLKLPAGSWGGVSPPLNPTPISLGLWQMCLSHPVGGSCLSPLLCYTESTFNE